MNRYLSLSIACCITTASAFEYKPTFSESMGEEITKISLKTKTMGNDKTMPFFTLLKDLYIQNHPHRTIRAKNPLIPKKIHQIWLGPAKPPPLFKTWQKTIRTLHPQWEYKLWTDKDLETFSLYNRHLYDISNNYGERSDILRYEILYHHGGVYLDIDFECVKPLDALHHCYDFYTGILPLECRSILTNGIIGCAPCHPIIRYCIASLSKNENQQNIIEKTGPQHLESSFWKVASSYHHSKIIALPTSYFFPLKLSDTLNKSHGKEYVVHLKPETLAIHYWTRTWTVPQAKVKH